jgi:hypothetical protein
MYDRKCWLPLSACNPTQSGFYPVWIPSDPRPMSFQLYRGTLDNWFALAEPVATHFYPMRISGLAETIATPSAEFQEVAKGPVDG